MRSSFVVFVVGLLLLPWLAGARASACAPAQQSAPDVLLIVLDDVGWEDVAALPLANLATFAPAGRVYTRCYTNPVCTPTRAALLSGIHPHRDLIGTAVNDEVGLPARTKTLPEVFAANGWATGLFGKSHISGSAGMSDNEQARVHGFETWRAGSPTNIPSHYAWSRTDDGKRTISSQYSTSAVFDEVCTWWSATPGPKFAVVAPYAPHEPFQAPPPGTLPAGYTVGTTPRELYEAALVALDWHLGCLLSVVDMSRTHVLLVTDNGTPHQVPPPGAKSKGYQLTLYEGGVRVPFVWWGPGVAPGVDATLVQTLDVPRTVLEVCGLTSPCGFDDSLSFLPTLSGGSGTRAYAYLSRFSPNGPSPTGVLTIDDWAVVRDDGIKLVKQGTTLALFDTNNDPWEQFPFPPSAPGYAMALVDLQGYRLSVLGTAWPY